MSPAGLWAAALGGSLLLAENCKLLFSFLRPACLMVLLPAQLHGGPTFAGNLQGTERSRVIANCDKSTFLHEHEKQSGKVAASECWEQCWCRDVRLRRHCMTAVISQHTFVMGRWRISCTMSAYCCCLSHFLQWTKLLNPKSSTFMITAEHPAGHMIKCDRCNSACFISDSEHH